MVGSLAQIHKIWYQDPILQRNRVFATNSDILIDLYLCNPKSKVFHILYSVRSNNLSLKHQRFEPFGWKDIGIEKLDFVAEESVYFYHFEGHKLCGTHLRNLVEHITVTMDG